jgi:shikimate dehydrogenase
MHNAALKALGIPGRYEARRVDGVGMAQAAAEMRMGLLDGANITMPHKALAFELADEVVGDALRAGSVNTWVPIQGRIEGHSSDITGIRRVVEARGLGEGRASVLGSGGAAAAALVALEGRQVRVIARNREKAAAMVARCGVESEICDWADCDGVGVVVNCTSVGMHGEALPIRFLEQATGYFELVYAGGETPAEAAARSRGVPVASGLDLLAAQAEVSFELWTGIAPPSGVMYRAGTNLSSITQGGPNHA